MRRYAVFLRGVNVGGVTIKSAELRETFESLAVREVKTLLASGNVVCSSDLPADALKMQSEEALRKRFSYDAWVVVLDLAAVEHLVEACPFPADDPAVHTYLTLFSDAAVLDELMRFADSIGEPVRKVSSIAAVWRAPKGQTLESPLNAFTNRSRFKSAATTRNLRTIQKVLTALRG